MQEILPGILTWGATYEDKPWDLNGYAIRLDTGTVLVDPPEPEVGDWEKFDALRPITQVVLTNRDHARGVELFRARYGAAVVAGMEEVGPLAPVHVDLPVRDGALIAGVLRVIHLPGKSPGEIGLYFEPEQHALSREVGGIMLLGDAIIGHPPGSLGLIPESKMDDPAQLRRSLRRLLDFEFGVLLLCDGLSVPGGAKAKVRSLLQSFD